MSSDDPDDAADEGLDEELEEELDEDPLGDTDEPEFLSAIVLRPKPAFLEWAQSVIAAEENAEGAMEPVVVLAPSLLRRADVTLWIEQNHREILTRQLAVWTEDAARWPAELSFDALRAWFDIEIAAGVDDLRHYRLLPTVTCDPVSLKLLVAVFVGLPDNGTLFVDVRSGAVVGLSDDDIAAMQAEDPAAYGLAASDLEQMRRVYESDTLLDVIGASDVDELALMAEFAESQPIQGHRNRLLDALAGKKARRQFKNAVEAAGLTERWEQWQASAVQSSIRAALEFCRIPYVNDVEAAGQ